MEPTVDESVLKLRAETARIYRDLQLARDAQLTDKLTAGEFGADRTLNAFSSAFTLQSGEEWVPPSVKARRATLIGASSGEGPYRLHRPRRQGLQGRVIPRAQVRDGYQVSDPAPGLFREVDPPHEGRLNRLGGDGDSVPTNSNQGGALRGAEAVLGTNLVGT